MVPRAKSPVDLPDIRPFPLLSLLAFDVLLPEIIRFPFFFLEHCAFRAFFVRFIVFFVLHVLSAFAFRSCVVFLIQRSEQHSFFFLQLRAAAVAASV